MIACMFLGFSFEHPFLILWFNLINKVKKLMSIKSYVGNLAFSVDENNLTKLFETECGVTITSCKIITDRESGRSKGFAFVEFKTPEEREKAEREMNGQEFEGRNLRVNEAQSKEGGSKNEGGYSQRQS
jgi:cold-inducible RNA-binding protein